MRSVAFVSEHGEEYLWQYSEDDIWTDPPGIVVVGGFIAYDAYMTQRGYVFFRLIFCFCFAVTYYCISARSSVAHTAHLGGMYSYSSPSLCYDSG